MFTGPTSASAADSQREFNRQIGNLFDNDEFSDLVLIVGVKRFAVHKAILATRSEYFRTLFTSSFTESKQKEVTIEETNPHVFEKLLRYIYSNEAICKPNLLLEEKLHMLKMSNKYLLFGLQATIEEELISQLTLANFRWIYSAAYACSSVNLKEACFELAESQPSDFLKIGGLSKLDAEALEEIIRRDAFGAYQVELFRAISKWCDSNGKANAGILLSKIRLWSMSVEFLATTVRMSGFHPDKCILDAIAANMPQVKVQLPISLTVHIRHAPWNRMNTLNDLDPFDTVQSIVEKIKLQIRAIDNGDGARSFHLCRDGALLKMRRTLESYSIPDGAMLETRALDSKEMENGY